MKFNSAKLTISIAILTLTALIISVFCIASFATGNSSEPSSEAVEQTQQEATASSDGFSKGMGLLAAAIVTSLAGIGGGIAVAAGAPAAIAATAENPKSFGKSIIFVALGESIALYGVVISILILNKI